MNSTNTQRSHPQISCPPALAIALGLVVLTGNAAHANAPLTIPWYTIDGGGGRSTSVTLRLTGTIGQPDATRRASLTSGTLTLTGGFWALTNEPPCLGDYNSDPGVDILDFLDFIDDFSSCDNQPSPCGTLGDPDINGDGVIDILDFLDFINAFSQGC